MSVPKGTDTLLTTLASNPNGGRSYGGGTVLMVAVPAPSTGRRRLSPVQTALGLGAFVSLLYLAYRAHR